MRRVIIVLVAVLLAGAVGIGLQAQEKKGPPRPQRKHKPPPKFAAKGEAGQLTRIQICVFEVGCLQDQLADLDLEQLSADDPAPGEMLQRLSAKGKARLLARLDNMLDLAQQSEIQCGSRVPMVQDVTISKTGVVTPSVTYEEFGTGVIVNGRWSEMDQVARAALHLKLEIQTVSSSAVKVAKGVTLPKFMHFEIEQPIDVTSGEPVYILANHLAEVGDGPNPAPTMLVQLKATCLGD